MKRAICVGDIGYSRLIQIRDTFRIVEIHPHDVYTVESLITGRQFPVAGFEIVVTESIGDSNEDNHSN